MAEDAPQPAPQDRHPRRRALVAAAALTAVTLLLAATLPPGLAGTPEPGSISLTTLTRAAEEQAGARERALQARLDAGDPTVPLPTPEPSARTPQPPLISDPAPSSRSCSIADRIAAAGGDAHIIVYGHTAEATLLRRDAGTPLAMASATKVLTAALALQVLGPQFRFETEVRQGAAPGEIVLVGGGDPTLSRTPAGAATIYGARVPHLPSLLSEAAAAEQARTGAPVTRVVLDESRFAARQWASSWFDDDRLNGDVAYVSPLMLDGDRADPAAHMSVRSTDPQAAVRESVTATLGGVEIVEGRATVDAPVLAAVRSAPLTQLVAAVLKPSDNTLADQLALQVLLRAGAPGTLSEVGPTFERLFASELGLDASGLRMVDGSGLAGDDRVPLALLPELIERALDGEPRLATLVTSLPVAGIDGTLAAPRYAGSAAYGNVNAKTGTLTGRRALAGVAYARDGSVSVFAIVIETPGADFTAPDGIDRIAEGIWACGDQLAPTG